MTTDVNSISFFPYSYYQIKKDQQEVGDCAIKNSAIVRPEAGESLADGPYNPLSRRLCVKLYDSLCIMVPSVKYALTQEGLDLEAENENVPFPQWDAQVMPRLGTSDSPYLATIKCGVLSPHSSMLVGAPRPILLLHTSLESSAMLAQMLFWVYADAAFNLSQRVCGNSDYGIPLDIGDMSIP